MPEEQKESKEEQPMVIGRLPNDVTKYGTRGSILLGRQYEEKLDRLFLTRKLYMDISGAHVVLICGKRGGGKSYTMGVIAEGLGMLEPDIRQNLSIILLDTMGIYWTMGHANQKEKELLEPYGLKPKPIDVKIFTPEKYYYDYKKRGIRTDIPFSIEPHQLSGDDWCMAFRQDKYSANGLYIQKLVEELREAKGRYSINDVFDALDKDNETDKITKAAVKNMFKSAEAWGIFSDHGTPIDDLAKGGQVTVLDVSCYATMPGGNDVKSLAVGLVARHLFTTRMESRKEEELQEIKYLETYFEEVSAAKARKQQMPLVWLVLDEAHEFLPKDEKASNAATEPLVTIMREGRQPGLSLILATQQPGKIHTDVMTQSDIVISHRITARLDVQALGLLAQSYMEHGIERAMNDLPPTKGTAVVFDDLNEKILMMRVRPRVTWHGGASPTAMKE
ncbi:ATP-binding protein [archaeon]|nr:ATP-binding protein [archaeon]